MRGCAGHRRGRRRRAAGCGRSRRTGSRRSWRRSARGQCASGPSIRSANTVSMMACWRWVMSACGDRQVGVGEERVIPPDREQRVGVTGVFDAAHDKPGGDPVTGGPESGIGDFGDLGIGDPGAGVGIAHGAGVAHRGPGVVGDRGDRRVDRACCGSSPARIVRRVAATRAHHLARSRRPSRRAPGSARRCGRCGRCGRCRWPGRPSGPRPCPSRSCPARSRSPAITGAERGVLIVVPSGDSPLRRTCLPAILVCP